MNAIESINHFVDVMLDRRSQFQGIKADIDTRNSAVKRCIASFEAAIDGIMKRKAKIENSELQELSEHQFEVLRHLLDVVAESLEHTRESMKFINEYEDTFNIAVFGKVKAGKSYTGNFIMGNEIRDLGIHTSYDKIPRPTVEVKDRGKTSTQDKLSEFDSDAPQVMHDEDGAEKFFVDPNEATMAIQLFRLGGMVWIDTPGIGSTNWENEMLAKDFVDNADLIVYMSHSDAAGTQQDFTEMRALHDRDKRFVLLLTQSDTTEVDIDDDGRRIRTLVPKSDEDRDSMESYICTELAKNNINMDRGREVITISTKLALEGLKRGDEAMFESSNMKLFLDVLVEITCNDAAKLKLATPAIRVNTMIDNIIHGLTEADEKLSKHMKALEEIKQRLTDRDDYLRSKMQNECIMSITDMLRRNAADVDMGKTGWDASEIQNIVGREIHRVIMETCAEEFAGSEAILSDYADSLKIGGVTGLAMRQDKIISKRTQATVYERDPEGIWEHVKSWLGNKYYGTMTKTIVEEKNVDVGVNLQQVLAEVRKEVDAIFTEQVPDIMRRITDDFIAPVSQVRKNAGDQIQETIRELTVLKL